MPAIPDEQIVAAAPVLVPIGSVVAFLGSVDAAHILPRGWLLCDGSPLKTTQAPDLFAAIGTANGDGRDAGGIKVADFNLPDLRGYFLRGTDSGVGRDKDAGRRASVNGGNAGDAVGSVQPFATSLPVTGFTTDVTPDHSHVLPLETTAGRSDGGVTNTVAQPTKGPTVSTIPAGSHSHAITEGGDEETRPINVNVNWIIRAA